MRIVFFSDSHGMHDQITLPEGDVLIHSGDFSSYGNTNDTKNFLNWYLNLKGFDTKIFIAGNHDLKFELNPKPNWLQNILYEENLSQSDCVYLEDSSFTIDDSRLSQPIKFYGSPWQPEFLNWAFNLPRNGIALEKTWNAIPDDTDILITHCPPYGIRDIVNYKPNQYLGCELLRKRIDIIKPLIHCFGHIHDSYGPALINNTAFINASICTERYKPINKPIVIDIEHNNNGNLITNLIN